MASDSVPTGSKARKVRKAGSASLPSRLGLVSNFYFDAHLQLVSAATMNKHDVALAISHIGRMPFLLETVDVAKEQGANAIVIATPGSKPGEKAIQG